MQPLELPTRAFLFFVVVITVPLVSSALANTESVQSQLAVNEPVERELKGKQDHQYQVWLESGQFARVIVDQQGIDLMIWLVSPNGDELAVTDSPNGSFGVETILLVAAETGNYLIKVGPQRSTARPGRYRIELQELRLFTSGDQDRVTAQRLCSDAIRRYILSKDTTAQTNRQAL